MVEEAVRRRAGSRRIPDRADSRIDGRVQWPRCHAVQTKSRCDRCGQRSPQAGTDERQHRFEVVDLHHHVASDPIEVAETVERLDDARFAIAAQEQKGASQRKLDGNMVVHREPMVARHEDMKLVRCDQASGTDDGSLHLNLPLDLAAHAIDQGWAENHPMSVRGIIPRNVVMVRS